MPERFKVTKADEANAELKDEESAMGHLLEDKKGKQLNKFIFVNFKSKRIISLIILIASVLKTTFITQCSKYQFTI